MKKKILTASAIAAVVVTTITGCAVGRAPVQYRINHGNNAATAEDTRNWVAGIALDNGWRVCDLNGDGVLLHALQQWDEHAVYVDIDVDKAGVELRPDLVNSTLRGPDGRAHRSVNNWTKTLHKQIRSSLESEGFAPRQVKLDRCGIRRMDTFESHSEGIDNGTAVSFQWLVLGVKIPGTAKFVMNVNASPENEYAREGVVQAFGSHWPEDNKAGVNSVTPYVIDVNIDSFKRKDPNTASFGPGYDKMTATVTLKDRNGETIALMHTTTHVDQNHHKRKVFKNRVFRYLVQDIYSTIRKNLMKGGH